MLFWMSMLTCAQVTTWRSAQQGPDCAVILPVLSFCSVIPRSLYADQQNFGGCSRLCNHCVRVFFCATTVEYM